MPDGGGAELLCLHVLCVCVLGLGATIMEPLLGSGMGCSKFTPLTTRNQGRI